MERILRRLASKAPERPKGDEEAEPDKPAS
jgi:hypothetical protein